MESSGDFSSLASTCQTLMAKGARLKREFPAPRSQLFKITERRFMSSNPQFHEKKVMKYRGRESQTQF